LEAGVVAAQPEAAAGGIEGDGVDAAADQAPGRARILRFARFLAAPDLEPVAVEARQPVLGGHPEEALVVAGQRHDRGLWQALVGTVRLQAQQIPFSRTRA